MANSAWADMPMGLGEVLLIVLAFAVVWVQDKREQRRAGKRLQRWREEHDDEVRSTDEDVE